MTGRPLAAVALAAVSVAWLDPHATARETSRLYASGKFDDAAGKYNEALVDRPDSPLLHFNLGDALYRQGKFTDAVNALQQVPGTDADSTRTARVAYNIGNAKYRLAQAAEASDPKSALGLYAEAIVAYRRAMGAAPDDVDAKFNHEFVARKMDDLKKKLEEQQQQQQAAAEKTDGEMSKDEAAALLDAQRDQEVRPDEVVKKLQGAAVAEPVEDW